MFRRVLQAETGMTGESVRVFLFLQGPHGPFFQSLAHEFRRIGHAVQRIAFNVGDEAEWATEDPIFRFSGKADELAEWLESHVTEHHVTDIVLYGDGRPVHRVALEVARRCGLTPHCFEEGYIRPSWVTYERHGNNGNSRLMDFSLPRMERALPRYELHTEIADDIPAIWGDAREHVWHSAVYHARCLVPSRRFGRLAPHRNLSLFRECLCYASRVLQIPVLSLRRSLQCRKLLRSAKRYHLVLLQLSFDASMQVYSDYRSNVEFISDVFSAFAEGAATDDLLVLKSHPFEDGREQLHHVVSRLARHHGVHDRVIFIDGGIQLSEILERARSAVTINSTAAQQALARGLPVAALGRAIYRKPGLVSEQTLPEFMAFPRPPDRRAYALFRHFLMKTSQITGSYYSAIGRARLLRVLPGLMLDPVDPYDHALAEPDYAVMSEDQPSQVHAALKATG